VFDLDDHVVRSRWLELRTVHGHHGLVVVRGRHG
jgi:hypothetical protein